MATNGHDDRQRIRSDADGRHPGEAECQHRRDATRQRLDDAGAPRLTADEAGHPRPEGRCSVPAVLAASRGTAARRLRWP